MERDARLEVVHVLPLEDGSKPRPPRTAAEWLRLRDLVAREIPRSQHLTTRLRIAYGNPGKEPADAADHAELLVVGARARSEHGDPFGGDTVPVVREWTRRPVVICADHTVTSQHSESL